MAIESYCTGCGKLLAVADENAGKRARCPACGQIYTVPSSSSISSEDILDKARQASPLPGSDSASGSRNPFADRQSSAADENSPSSAQPPEGDSYWMLAVDGSEYGPVDRATLDRWFMEGRVGPGYQLRQNKFANWQPANSFRSAAGAAGHNPYTDQAQANNPYQTSNAGAGSPHYPQGNQGGVVLVMGVLGIFCCPIFSIVAWVMGHSALKSIDAGLADPNSRSLVQIGYYLGIAGVVLGMFCYGGQILIAALGVVGKAGM